MQPTETTFDPATVSFIQLPAVQPQPRPRPKVAYLRLTVRGRPGPAVTRVTFADGREVTLMDRRVPKGEAIRQATMHLEREASIGGAA